MNFGTVYDPTMYSGSGDGQYLQSAPPTAGTGSTVVGGLVSLVGGIVDIFGNRQPQQQMPVHRPATGTPLWVWIMIPVAGIVVLGVAARAMRKRKK